MELVTKLLVLEAWALLFAAYSWLFIVDRGSSGHSKASPARKLTLAAPAIVINLIAPLILNHDTEPLLITPAAGMCSLAGFKVRAVRASSTRTLRTKRGSAHSSSETSTAAREP